MCVCYEFFFYKEHVCKTLGQIHARQYDGQQFVCTYIILPTLPAYSISLDISELEFDLQNILPSNSDLKLDLHASKLQSHLRIYLYFSYSIFLLIRIMIEIDFVCSNILCLWGEGGILSVKFLHPNHPRCDNISI